ncbi:beta-lactamase/transpeptidase-like protein [Fennellomyces sp. T-0311]|nr:beta-lactamase/transpeptidase-like protein [Fennellomyces sp. T-0311]
MASKTTKGQSKVAKASSPDTVPKAPAEAKRSVVWVLLKVIGLVLVLTAVAIARIANEGAFTPWSCSVFGYGCSKRYDVPFSGYVDEEYVSAEQAFKENFFRGEDIGATATAYVDGKLVLNVQGGWQSVEKRIPYTESSLQMVFSSTKSLAYIAVAQFVDKGALSYDEKIATYWPEFAQGNKENVTLGDLMQHAAGVSYLDRPVTSEEFDDPERRSRILAAQPHTFGGVRTRAYHAATHGWYINEILRRVANCTVNDVAAELNEKYGIEWHLRPYQEQYDDRIAHFYEAPTIPHISRSIKMLGGLSNFIQIVRGKNPVLAKTSTNGVLDSGSIEGYTTLRLRRIESPAYSGFTNSHSIAKLAAMMANGGKAIVDGEPDLLSSETYTLATEPMPVEFDVLFQKPMAAVKGGWGSVDGFVIEDVQFFGWIGMGGSVFLWNPEHKIGFGYSMNGFVPTFDAPDNRSVSILRAIVKQALKKKV